MTIPALSSIEQYRKLIDGLQNCSTTEKISIARHLCRTDLFFLLWYGLQRGDIAHPWLLERAKEVQNSPNEHLDLWAREHYKSTIITYAKSIQDVLASHGNDPLPEWGGVEVTIGIFSHTRPIAKGFLRQIKREFESNQLLLSLFPDVLWENPQKDAPKWSEDDGLIVKRKSNPKESTIEAWGLVDGQPTSKHFHILNYDDVVTIDSVRSPEMIAKTTEALELSFNLGAHGGHRRFIGTRYHYNDSYRTILKRGTASPRIYPATHDGEMTGNPVMLTTEILANKRRDMGPYTFACQMLQNPKADSTQGFRREWLRWYHGSVGGTNIYMICDPANEKKKKSDYTSIVVWGLGTDKNYYLLDAVRDRLNLTERTSEIMRLHRKWSPRVVGYEKYGKDSDIEHIQYVQAQENYRFEIRPLGGQMSKIDRIRRLIPPFEQGRVYFPDSIHRTIHDGTTIDVIEQFLNEEFDPFPVSVHDDMLDALSRIMDEDLFSTWPRTAESAARYSTRKRTGSSWMTR